MTHFAARIREQHAAAQGMRVAAEGVTERPFGAGTIRSSQPASISPLAQALPGSGSTDVRLRLMESRRLQERDELGATPLVSGAPAALGQQARAPLVLGR